MRTLRRNLTVSAMLMNAAIGLSAQTFTTLDTFNGTDGQTPFAGLTQATNGDLYGTNFYGGQYSVGTVFKITPDGKLTSVYSFNGYDGSGPQAGLVQASNGDLYGTTNGGNVNLYGSIFKITPAGALTSLTFCSQGSPCLDGASPEAGLIQATNGDLYGTTLAGGTLGLGTIFKITPAGSLTTVHSFDGPDGARPLGSLMQATNGDLYGTTSGNTSASPYGTIFRMTPSGDLTTIHTFCSQILPNGNCLDGDVPYPGLIQASNGLFYGTTYYGGAYGLGSIFEMNSSGSLATIYSFCPQKGCADGAFPIGPLVQATNGNIYGTTEIGGANCSGSGGCGTIFEFTTAGALTTIYSFCTESGCPDGSYPYAGLLQDTNGVLYGTTTSLGSGPGYDGTIFSLSLGLARFVESQTTSGKVGTVIKILGTNLTGATSVTFNGAQAAFTLVAGTLISATVPSAATTGTIQVVTPSGTLSSNVIFRVLP